MTNVSRVAAGGFTAGGCALILFSVIKLFQELSYIYAPNYTGSWAGLTWLISLVAVLIGGMVMGIGEQLLRANRRMTTLVISGALGWIVLTFIVIFNIISIPEFSMYMISPLSIVGPPIVLVHRRSV